MRILLCSVSLPRRWNGPFITELLPIQILPLVEYRVPASSFRTHKRGDEAYKLRLLLLLQFASYTGRDGLDHYRVGHR